MSEHNFHEIAPAALAGVVAKGAKVMGAAKGAGKVAKKAGSLLSAGSDEAEATSARVNEDNLNEALPLALPLAAPAVKGLAAGAAALGGAYAGKKGLDALQKTKPMKTSSSEENWLKTGSFDKTKPKQKPLPTTAKLKTLKPSRDYQKEKQSAGATTMAPGASKEDQPKAVPASNQRGASMKDRTDAGSAANVGSGIKSAANAVTGAATGVGTAAAVGTLAAMKGKLPKPNLDTGGKAGKTKDRVSYKKQSEELEVVCDYLLDNGFADTGVQAETMYEHMTEEWKTHILNS